MKDIVFGVRPFLLYHRSGHSHSPAHKKLPCIGHSMLGDSSGVAGSKQLWEIEVTPANKFPPNA